MKALPANGRSIAALAGAAVLYLAPGVLPAQPAAATPPEFEVASIKPAPAITPMMVASGQMHFGMHVDKARVDIGNQSLGDLIRLAYKIKPYQLSGPDWMKGMGAPRFDVLAKLPEGASTEQVPEMLQALLAERFKLVVHRSTKEQPVYALVVGKGGPKLKEAAPDTDAPGGAGGAGGDGGAAAVPGAGTGQVSFSRLGGGRGMEVNDGQGGGPMRVTMGQGGIHFEWKKATMSQLADRLSSFGDRPVVDMTELKGNYEVALDLSMDDMRNAARAAGMAVPQGPGGGGEPGRAPADAASDPSSTSIFTAVQQLGLKLEPRKAPLDLIVVDHAEKVPTEN